MFGTGGKGVVGNELLTLTTSQSFTAHKETSIHIFVFITILSLLFYRLDLVLDHEAPNFVPSVSPVCVTSIQWINYVVVNPTDVLRRVKAIKYTRIEMGFFSYLHTFARTVESQQL